MDPFFTGTGFAIQQLIGFGIETQVMKGILVKDQDRISQVFDKIFQAFLGLTLACVNKKSQKGFLGP